MNYQKLDAAQPQKGDSMIEDHGCEILTSNGWVRAENLTAHNERMAESMEAHLKQERGRVASLPKYSCPFKTGANCICSASRCAWYVERDCVLRPAVKPSTTTGTVKAQCPFGGSCRPTCVLHDDAGCAITSIMKSISGKE